MVSHHFISHLTVQGQWRTAMFWAILTTRLQGSRYSHSFFRAANTSHACKRRIKEGMSCLDVGCGAGFTTQSISQMIGKKGHVIGIDVDERYLQYCRNAKQQTNAEFMLDDI
jgi:2-polyprenyl-3-methyl-5-hydroxy-6-metoxy-1,4-benzoquinol methylase